jgi:hypothetical protein
VPQPRPAPTIRSNAPPWSSSSLSLSPHPLIPPRYWERPIDGVAPAPRTGFVRGLLRCSSSARRSPRIFPARRAILVISNVHIFIWG